MKKILLLIICALCVILLHAQPQGYFWFFNSAPYNSIPAVPGSPATYALTPIGSGTITPGTSSTVVLGSSCNGSFPVARLLKPAGFIFNNNPSFITGNYTIEMVCSYDDVSGYKKLIDFFYPLGGFDFAIYITDGSLNVFQNSGLGTIVTAPIFFPNSYFQLDITRDAATQLMTFYQNGIVVGSFADINNYFAPGTFTQNIRIFKDNTDDFEESNTRVAKIGIFNSILSGTQIQQNFNNICNAGFLILPVTIESFTAKKIQQQVGLSWTTSEEEHNRGFEIQRSSDGINFNVLGWVPATGTAPGHHDYSFPDPSPLTGKNFYRLKQIDINGKFNFSHTCKVDFASDIDLTMYPNPAKHDLTVQFTGERKMKLLITDMAGRVIWIKDKVTMLSMTIPLQQLAKGFYFLIVLDEHGKKEIQPFIKE